MFIASSSFFIPPLHVIFFVDTCVRHLHVHYYICKQLGNCALNSDCEETSIHLFFECPFSTYCRQSISISLNMQLHLLDMVINARNVSGNHMFREIVIST
jgi:hypothetical protein